MTSLLVISAALIGFLLSFAITRPRPVVPAKTFADVVSEEEVARPVGPDGFYHAKTYASRKKLLSEAELSFYHVLQSALPDGFQVFAKVRMADVLEPARQHASDRQTALNRISSKHVDFLVCKAKTGEFCAAVELDDSSHAQSARKDRDSFVDQSFEEAGIPMLRFRARSGYSLESVRSEFRKLNLLKPNEPALAAPQTS